MSLAVRRALYGKMSGDTTLNGLLGTVAPGYSKSIYHEQAPENASFPYVIFSKSSGVPTQTFHTPTAYQTDVWLIKGVDRGDTSDAADNIADRLTALLNDATLSISGKSLMYLRRDSDVEYSELVDGVSYRHSGALYRLIFQ